MYNSLYGASFTEGDLSIFWLQGYNVISSEVKRRLSTHINSYKRFVVQPLTVNYNPLSQEPPLQIIEVDSNYGSTIYDQLSQPFSSLSSSSIVDLVTTCLGADPRITAISVENSIPPEINVKFKVDSSLISITV